MPTQAELDREQNRQISSSDTIGIVAGSGGVYDLSTDPRSDYNKEGTDDRLENDGIDTAQDDPSLETSASSIDGYEDVGIYLCQNGEPVHGQILFKEDA